VHIINLLVGDWSHDGHEKTQKFTIESSLNQKELMKAYKKGCKIIGFDLTKDCCAEYEEFTLLREHKEKLKLNGFYKDPDQLNDLEEEEEKEYSEEDPENFMYADAFKDIWLFFIKTGNPSFTFNQKTETINIGGYGLFQ
jgi:hypothetical protein